MSAPIAPTVLPLTAAVIYLFSVLLVKRAGSYGLGFWRIAFVTNQIVALEFAMLWFLGGKIPMDLLWQPAVIAILFVSGQALQFMALDRGDVSVAVPVFGLKVILVNWLTVAYLGQVVRPALWVAGVLSVLAVTCLNRKDHAAPSRNLGITLFGGGVGSVCFALFDVLVQRWAGGTDSPWGGIGRFLPIMFAMSAVLSLGLMPFFKASLRQIPRPAWRFLIPSAALMGCQSILFILSFTTFHGNPASANILYSSRGLWSVIGVWLIGHWFQNDEQNLAGHVLRWRTAGALLMMSAIGLVLWR